ncbi:hypothetical protein [Herbiconiux liangxiaofengii]|uniref:hypothetical protein n=1 Tax=Herbiconiux liangxiaofengii TaxID=3342795 RepID=UPI0035B85371
MVAEFLRLRLRLLGNAGRRPASQLVGVLIGLAYAVVMTVVLVAGLIALRSADSDTARTTVVIGGSLVTAGFWFVPLIFGMRDRFDPRSFALFGLSDGRLALGLLVAAFLGVPALVVSIVSLASIVTWSQSPGSTLLAVVSAVVGAVTCVLGARIAVSLGSFAFSSRRARDIGAVVGVLAVLVLVPGILLIMITGWGGSSWGGGDEAVLPALAGALGWTPLGAAWAVPADAVNGEWVYAVLKLLIALATLGLLWLGWRGLVSLMLVSPGNRVDETRDEAGLGWFGRVPATPTGAITARVLTYWARDPRYFAQLVIVPAPAVLAVLVFAFVGVPIEYTALLPLPLMCVFLGWVMHNDVAFDNTAVWLHLVAGRVGLADRVGRMIPVVLIAVPLIGIGSFLSVLFADNLDALPAMLGVCTCLVATGLGLGSLFSARFPYPATRPGDSAFTQPQATGATSVLAQIFSLFGTLALSLPAIVYGVLGVFVDPEYFWVSLWAGVGVGVVVLVLGVVGGARIFDRRGPEILAAAQRN